MNLATLANTDQLDMALKAIGVHDMLNLAKMDRAKVKAYHESLGVKGLPEDEDMNISGDTNITVNYPGQTTTTTEKDNTAAAATATTTTNGTTPITNPVQAVATAQSTLAKWASIGALAAGLLGAGATGPAALSTLQQLFTTTTQTDVQAQAGTTP